MRNVKEAMRYEVCLDDLEIELHFTNLKNDGSPADEIYKSVARQMAADYSRDLARKVIQGMVRKSKQGSALGGIPPFGYRHEKDTNNFIWRRIREDEASAVRKMFELSANGWGHKQIAIWLNEQNIPSSEAAKKRNSGRNKNPDGKWSRDTVRAVLRNPVYIGISRWNKRARVDCFNWQIQGEGTIEIGKLRTELPTFRKNGEHCRDRREMEFYIDRTKPEGEWVVVKGGFPTIVSEELFNKVQSRFGSYSSKKWKRTNEMKYFMSGLLRCVSCGNGISGHRYSKVIKTTGVRAYYEYYRCSGDIRKGNHPSGALRPMVKQDAIDNVVLEGIERRLQVLVKPARIKELFMKRMTGFLVSKPDRLSRVDQQIKKLEGETDRLIYAHSKLDRPLPEDKVSELLSRKKSLELERENLVLAGETRTGSLDIDHEVDRFTSKIKEVGIILRTGDPKNRILVREAFLSKAEIVWYNTRPEVKLSWRRLPRFTELVNHTTSTTYFCKLLTQSMGYAKTGVTHFILVS